MDNVCYTIDKADMAVWNLRTGVIFEQLCNDVSSRIGWEVPTDVLFHLERYVNWCIWAKLIEVRDFGPDQFTNLMQQVMVESKQFSELLEASASALGPDESP